MSQERTSGYKKLTEQEVEQSITNLHGWKLANGKLNKIFEFDNFCSGI